MVLGRYRDLRRGSLSFLRFRQTNVYFMNTRIIVLPSLLRTAQRGRPLTRPPAVITNQVVIDLLSHLIPCPTVPLATA